MKEKFPAEEFEGAKLREKLKDLVEMIPTKGDNIKVIEGKCGGCKLCFKHCPGGCFEMIDGKAKYSHPELCFECGACLILCPTGAIDWTYPEGGTGVILRYT
ncbi:MAG TPA: 4Fe-4S binding protein [Candidatus Deferrimicrobium sp.]|nr:4Fe-4S binding protein [Candidatus Deferrimicrobium sp.]